MSESGILISQSELLIDRQYRIIREYSLPKWCANNQIQYDSNSMSGTWAGDAMELSYNWDISTVERDGEDINKITQEKRINLKYVLYRFSKLLFTIMVFASIFFLQRFGLDIIWSLNGIYGPIVYAAFSALMLLTASIFLYVIYMSSDIDSAPNPLVEGRSDGVSLHTNNVFHIFYLSFIEFPIILFVLIMNDHVLTLLAGGTIIAVQGYIYYMFYSSKGDKLIEITKTDFVESLRFASVPHKHIKTIFYFNMGPFTVISCIVGVYYLISYNRQLREYFEMIYIPGWVIFFDIFIMSIFVFKIAPYFWELKDEELKLSCFNFKSDRYSGISKLVDVGAVLFSSANIYLGLLFPVAFLLLPKPPYLYIIQSFYTFTLLASFIFFLYFPAGIIYQVRKERRDKSRLLEGCKKKTIEVQGYNQEYYLSDSDGFDAESFSTVRDDYIVISEGFRKLLDDRAFAALVAHEEAHIETSDTNLCILISFLSPLLLVGKNVLYSLVDFQSRELRADDYSIEKVDRKALLNALEALRKKQLESDEEDLKTAYSTFGPNFSTRFDGGDSNYFDAMFKLFFGGFTLVDAHKSLEERINRLKPEESVE